MFITKEESTTFEGINSALERVYNRAVEDTLKMLPEIIIGLIIKTKGINSAFESFKEKYPELAKRERDLAVAVEQLEMEDGSRSLDTILKLVPQKMEEMLLNIPNDQAKTIQDIERSANGFI